MTNSDFQYTALQDRHPYLLRADGIGVGIFRREITRRLSNEALARSTAEMYIGEAQRMGAPYWVRIDYWDGREWVLVQEWHS